MIKRSDPSPELRAREIFIQSRTVQRKLAVLGDSVEWVFFAVLPGTNKWAAASPLSSVQLRKMALQMLELADEVQAAERRRRNLQ
jgi:hypothetical protein